MSVYTTEKAHGHIEGGINMLHRDENRQGLVLVLSLVLHSVQLLLILIPQVFDLLCAAQLVYILQLIFFFFVVHIHIPLVCYLKKKSMQFVN